MVAIACAAVAAQKSGNDNNERGTLTQTSLVTVTTAAEYCGPSNTYIVVKPVIDTHGPYLSPEEMSSYSENHRSTMENPTTTSPCSTKPTDWPDVFPSNPYPLYTGPDDAPLAHDELWNSDGPKSEGTKHAVVGAIISGALFAVGAIVVGLRV
ncbi:hypothetical protein FPQ18DRAFT_305393 [Pyronema domesticum]|nr:hypothetical protein FPQ18DRAFT_305393 [Pyronema domesticum]